jgi:hypothetical protein
VSSFLAASNIAAAAFVPVENSFQEQIHRLRSKQFVDTWQVQRIELPHIISPGELNLKSAASAIVTNTPNLNILPHGDV